MPRDLEWLRAQPAIDATALVPRLRERLEAARLERRLTTGVYMGCLGDSPK